MPWVSIVYASLDVVGYCIDVEISPHDTLDEPSSHPWFPSSQLAFVFDQWTA